MMILGVHQPLKCVRCVCVLCVRVRVCVCVCGVVMGVVRPESHSSQREAERYPSHPLTPLARFILGRSVVEIRLNKKF